MVGAQRIEGRGDLRLVLAEDAWIDVEAARAAVHRAESAAAQEDWPGAWVAARIAQHIAARPLLPGVDALWLEEHRRDLEGTYLRSARAGGARRASGSAAASSIPPSGLRGPSSGRLPSARAATAI